MKIDACAICGSDQKTFLNGNPRMKPPITMGHEFTGVIDTVGRGVTGFAVGERIVMATSISCGQCAYCRRGWSNLCVKLDPMGFSYPGGMAEYVVIPEVADQERPRREGPRGHRPRARLPRRAGELRRERGGELPRGEGRHGRRPRRGSPGHHEPVRRARVRRRDAHPRPAGGKAAGAGPRVRLRPPGEHDAGEPCRGRARPDRRASARTSSSWQPPRRECRSRRWTLCARRAGCACSPRCPWGRTCCPWTAGRSTTGSWRWWARATPRPGRWRRR